jgi:hypothetical protein
MTPNGNVYFPPAHYLADYSLSAVPLGNHGTIKKKYALSDYASALPLV